jgi:beta-galactosidase
MKTKIPFFIFLFVLFIVAGLSENYAQTRQIIDFNNDWHFSSESVSGHKIEEDITLPHTWNARDAQEGITYYRGRGNYRKSFEADPSWENKRVFIRFEGVNIMSKAQLNGVEIGEHKGGYAAFCYEITDYLDWEVENTLEVEVSNEANLEVPPLVGDFNNYGGIYRPVEILVTEQICISPLDYASPGVYLVQKDVNENLANVQVKTLVSNTGDKSGLEYKVSLFDHEGKLLQELSNEAEIVDVDTELTSDLVIENPHLWHGKRDPYLYKVKVELVQNGRVLDEVMQPLGLRYYNIDANEGFFLNGEHLPLNGVSRHQDRQDMGSAITDKEHIEDMKIMLDMGISALRLAHYQHAEIIYDMADSAGLIVWAELPWVGIPGGFMGTSNGYENTPEFKANAKQQLLELIRQNYNHPSIVMWSIFNEIQNPEDAQPTELIKELNEIAKTEDPSRLTVGASMLDPVEEHENIHGVTDAIAWNRYFGWYYKLPEDMATFLDETHANYPDYKIGISEYGAGGSIHQHSEKLVPPNPMGAPHPEEWQSYYHEEHLKIFKARPFVWGTFVWNMFDFGSHFRREGDHFGINDKGLVTYDRKTKKDAFFFYKANWSEVPVLHITSKRFLFRDGNHINVKVYTNLENISLSVNGKELETKSPEDGIVEWRDIVLNPGNNGVIVRAVKDGVEYTDDCVWVYESPYSGMRLAIKLFDFMPHAVTIGIVGMIIGILLWIASRKQKTREKRGFGKILVRFLSIIIILLSLLSVVAKFIISSLLG